ncbi:MAG: alpha/beta hydrolase [Glaciecola sp.]
MLHELSFNVKPTALCGLANDTFLSQYNENDTSAGKWAVIFLHGYLDNANSFASLLPLLQSMPCLAIDMAGHGKSSHRSADAHYHLVDYAYDLHCLIDSLPMRKVILVGHSLGGIVSSIYASTQPAKLAGFIAIETAGPLSQDANTSAEQIRDSFASRDKAYDAIKQPNSLAQLVKARCAMSDLNAQHAEQILSRNVCVTTAENGSESLQWRTDKRLRTKSCMRLTEAQAVDIVTNIRVPRAVILGSEGFDKVKRIISERDELFKNTAMFTCDGGHHVHLDSPESVANIILEQIKLFS